MKLLKKYLLLLLIFSAFHSYSQMYQRKKVPLVDLNGTYKMRHFYFNPGLTYMLPNFKSNGNDTSAVGRVAYTFGAGMYHIFKDGGNIFNYMDYGIDYKKLSGVEKLDTSKNIFKQHFISFNYNLNNIYQLSSTKFIQTSIGTNLDWKFAEKKENDLKPNPNNTKSLLLSLHLKVGYGMKFQNRLFIIPSIETPIINFLEWEKGKSTYGIFNSRYRPILLRVRILWLKRPSKFDCPPVKLNSQDKERYQNNYMQ